MSANDSLNLRINQRIENSVDLGPRHTENMGDALRLEYAHDELSTCLSSDARLFGHVHPLMRLFGISQLFCRVPAEIGLEECFRFRKSKMKIGQRFNLKPQNVGRDVE